MIEISGWDILVAFWNMWIKDLWWLWFLLIFATLAPELIKAIIERIKRDKKYSEINKIQIDKDLINRLRRLKPSEFEEYIAHLFNNLGFDTELVGGSYDGGIDIIATKAGVKHYIQCKKFISSQVSVGDVRDFYGALVDHLAGSKGYFITTNKFTLEAERFAEDKSIELIDQYRLLEYIKLSQIDNLEVANKNLDVEKCPQCGGNLIERKGKYGKFFGCSNYPKCRFIKKIN